MCGGGDVRELRFGSVLCREYEQTTHWWAVVAELYVVSARTGCEHYLWMRNLSRGIILYWKMNFISRKYLMCILLVKRLLAFWMPEKPFLVYLFASVPAYLVQVHRMKWCCSHIRSGKWVQCVRVCEWLQSWLMYAMWCMSRQFSQSKPKIVFKFALT